MSPYAGRTVADANLPTTKVAAALASAGIVMPVAAVETDPGYTYLELADGAERVGITYYRRQGIDAQPEWVFELDRGQESIADVSWSDQEMVDALIAQLLE